MKKNKNPESKSLFNRFASAINKLKVEDVLFVITLIIILMVVLSLLLGASLLSVYFPSVHDISLIYYFDFAVRHGILRYVYFAFVITLVYWLAKKILKGKLNTRAKAIAIVAGIMLASFIYLLPPYYLKDTQVLPGFFADYPPANEIFKINNTRCDDRVDFIFSPSSDQTMKVLPEIQALQSQGMQINIYCIGNMFLNDDILCRKKYELDSAEGERVVGDLGMSINVRKSYPGPILIFGCEYWVNDLYNANVTRQLICNYTELC